MNRIWWLNQLLIAYQQLYVFIVFYSFVNNRVQVLGIYLRIKFINYLINYWKILILLQYKPMKSRGQQKPGKFNLVRLSGVVTWLTSVIYEVRLCQAVRCSNLTHLFHYEVQRVVLRRMPSTIYELYDCQFVNRFLSCSCTYTSFCFPFFSFLNSSLSL